MRILIYFHVYTVNDFMEGEYSTIVQTLSWLHKLNLILNLSSSQCIKLFECIGMVVKNIFAVKKIRNIRYKNSRFFTFRTILWVK